MWAKYFSQKEASKFIQVVTSSSGSKLEYMNYLSIVTKYLSCRYMLFRRGYSISRRIVKLTRFKSFPLQRSGHQDIPVIICACCVINFNTLWLSVHQCKISSRLHLQVERLNTLNTDLQSLLQNIKTFASKTSSILTNTRSSRSHKFCRKFSKIF